MKRALIRLLALLVLGLIHFLSPRLEAQNRTWKQAISLWTARVFTWTRTTAETASA